MGFHPPATASDLPVGKVKVSAFRPDRGRKNGATGAAARRRCRRLDAEPVGEGLGFHLPEIGRHLPLPSIPVNRNVDQFIVDQIFFTRVGDFEPGLFASRIDRLGQCKFNRGL